MKVVFILPYFGKLPNYFDLFLKSCSYNEKFDWIIITDDVSKYNYPKNVKVIYEKFDYIKEVFQKKIDFNINLDRPHKLCDYKPAYGYLFKEIISEYDFWGHCDPDCIFGKLDSFIKEELLNEYEKIFTLGHMTLYKNEEKNNFLFKEKINGKRIYKEVFTVSKGCVFDEQNKNSINTIFINNNVSLYKKSFCADIDPYNNNFRLSIYDLENDRYNLEDIKKQIFYWDSGRLIRRFNNNLSEEEFSYIHLQKRNMDNNINNIESCNKFLIVPNEFIGLESDLNDNIYKRYCSPKLLNTQFLKTKFSSLKYRIKLLKCR